MMRYSVVSKTLSSEQIASKVRAVGGSDIKEAKLLRQVFCELDDHQVSKLSSDPNISVKVVREMKSTDISIVPITYPNVPLPESVTVEIPTKPSPNPYYSLPPQYGLLEDYTIAQANTLWTSYAVFRSLFTPPLTGEGLTVAVLDSGIHKTHNALLNKVVYEKNCTSSPTLDDPFGHGTQVAFVICGLDSIGNSGVSPGAKVMNIKVLDDEGVGSEESVVSGIEEVIEIVEAARRRGVHPTDDLYPNIINLSLGSPDDGDPDNAVRAACREAVNRYGIDIIAAAGNSGPKPSTVTIPATDDSVIAVGALNTDTNAITVWELSSRGPTEEGLTKPDFVIWGTNLEMASNKDNESYVVKSGTSFSCPMVSGITGLLWESVRRSYGPDVLFRWNVFKDYAPYYCTKPADAAVKKDNTYGYGLPAVGAMVGQITQPSTTAAPEYTQMLPMIFIMGMMGIMLKGVM